MFAARAALRILPVVRTAKYGGFSGVLVLPVFRAAVISWIAGKYPARETEIAAAAAYAYAAAVAAASDVASTIAYADAAAVRAAANADIYAAVGATNDDSLVNTAYATAFAARAADTYAAVGATRAADAYATIGAIRAADCAAAYSDARTYAIAAGDTEPGDAAHAAAYAGAAAAPFFWSALSIDATRLENGAASSAIVGSPLWPQGQPDQLQSMWQEMKSALLAEKQDWQVWTIWYDDRLDGRVRQEERELAYVRIDEALWSRGQALVNAEIVSRIEES